MKMVSAANLAAATAKVTARICHQKVNYIRGLGGRLFLYSSMPNALETLHDKADYLPVLSWPILIFFRSPMSTDSTVNSSTFPRSNLFLLIFEAFRLTMPVVVMQKDIVQHVKQILWEGQQWKEGSS